MRDRHALALLHLENRVVVVGEETALGNMGFKRRKRDRERLRFFCGRCVRAVWRT